MSSSNVVALHRNEELIAQLEVLLEEAKAGRLQALNAIVQRDGAIDFEIDLSQMGELELLGGIEMLKHVVLAGMFDSEE